MNKKNEVNVQRTWVTIDKLGSGMAYQRPIEDAFVAEKVAIFDELAVEPVCVSLREGKYNVVDGQHTIAILKAMGKTRAFCEIRTGLTEADESAWYYQKETKSRKQSNNRLLNARYLSGQDNNLNTLVDCLASVGYSLKLVNVKNTDGVINASDTVENIFNTLGCVDFVKYITLHQATWNGDKQSLKASLLKGLEKFYSTYAEKIDDKRFIKVFNTSVNPKAKTINIIEVEADSDVYTKNVALRYAKVFVKYYNLNLDAKKKLKPSLLED